MRWTGRIRFVFLLPAVIWVLAFTVFPLGYSLYLAFFKIESKVEVTRERVPVLDEAGQPVLLSSGKPKMENIVHRDQVTTATFVGWFNFERLFNDPQVATAIWVTAVFVLVAVPVQLALGMLLALLFNQQLLVRPVLRPIFPELPPDHPALGMIALNMAANVFGLGNAATPFGIKAMEELQKLNPSKDTATNSMVMLLAINTASMQLVPPVLLLALLGLQINQLIFPIILASLCSVVIAISAAKLYGRLPGYRASDPNRLPPS